MEAPFPTTLPQQVPGCPFHEGDDLAELVNKLLEKRWAANKIAGLAHRAGYPEIVTAQISAHRRWCLAQKTRIEAADDKRDLALLVRDRVAKELPTLEISVKDGLMAQQLLDRREETRRGREFMLNLARLLTGGGGRAPKQLIDGEFVEVHPDEDGRLLAPATLRGDD